MLCQKCHKNLATVRYAEVVDGQVSDQQLCAECMARHQNNATTGFELNGPAPGTRKAPTERAAKDTLRTHRACPSCGAMLSRIMDTGRVGCGACYENFGDLIESILEGLHRSLRHTGKVSNQNDARARLRADIQTKRALMRSVVRAEHYEEAARLRDEIRGLETGLNVSEAGAD